MLDVPKFASAADDDAREWATYKMISPTGTANTGGLCCLSYCLCMTKAGEATEKDLWMGTCTIWTRATGRHDVATH